MTLDLTPFRSHMGAYLVNARPRTGDATDPRIILSMTSVEMADERGLWESFAERYHIVRVGDDFYGRDGKVE